MNAFSTAVDRIFADPHMAVDAVWFPGGTGPGVVVRMIRKSPDEITPFGAGRILSETTQLDARVAEMPNPAPGDLIRIGAEDFMVQGEPKADRELLIWTLNTRMP